MKILLILALIIGMTVFFNMNTKLEVPIDEYTAWKLQYGLKY